MVFTDGALIKGTRERFSIFYLPLSVCILKLVIYKWPILMKHGIRFYKFVNIENECGNYFRRVKCVWGKL